MILRVGSSLASFKDVNFGPGLNLVVADQAAGSDQKETRNGVGKSLLVDIIHFCLGGNLKPDSKLCRPELKNESFYVSMKIGEENIAVKRSVETPGHVIVTQLPEGWLANTKAQYANDLVQLSIRDWLYVLGRQVFDLTDSRPHAPTFRSLISYFVRQGQAAFLSPFTPHPSMSVADKQVLNSFLLGLGWQYALEWQAWRDRNDALKDLKKAIKSGALASFGRSLGELEAERVRIRQQLEISRRELAGFKVLPEYEEIEREASRLTRESHRLLNANVSDNELLKLYEDSLHGEQDLKPEVVIELFQEAGVLLPELVKRRLDEVREFHFAVLQNRRVFLEQQIARIRSLIEDRSTKVVLNDLERSRMLDVLQTHGALEEYNSLQELNNELAGKFKQIEEQISLMTNIDRESAQLKKDQADLVQRAKLEFSEMRPIRDEAISIFNENSEHLYNVPGRLIIDVLESGYSFGVEIERDGSEGIDKMKIFCYDLMLARLWSSKPHSPKYLIHDSTLFDGVDERQRGHALERAFHETSANGFQYIAMFNSDSLPGSDYLGDVDLQDAIKLRLDDSPEGSLVGFRF